MKTLLLNKSEVYSLIDRDKILLAVEDGYRSFNKGLVVQPDFMAIEMPNTHAGVDFKGGLDMGGGYMTLKASSGGYAKNPELGLPRGMNTVMLFEASTSFLKCVMDGTWITGCRTAAAGAISVKHLSRPDAKKLCVIGAGNQARHQLRAICRVRDLSEVIVWNANEDEREQYIKEMTEETGLKMRGADIEESVSSADIIVTATIGRQGPVVRREWVKPGTHIAAIGADMPDKQELFSDVFSGAKVVCDSINICAKNGETHHALDDGIISKEDIHAEIGEVLLGTKPGRENAQEITIFDTVGMAIQDNVMASMLFKNAVEKNLGTWYSFLA
ncbi:ornithine cyclodeaminase family protein [Eubacteriales bacterium OttesenSCG-928-K08]|nr:ornithine cyclodeaminase family protein [Eubacteriales bacterium OttesenSCG-928-K08]